MVRDMQIDFDYNVGKEISQNPQKQIKILINLYNGHGAHENAKFKHHEKIVQKPVNLINYMINLIWDEQANNNADYLKFLSCICMD